jgi:hypothetical protein
MVIVGGRESIRNSLFNSGNTTHITGANPLRMCFARKHRVFGKNETCLKLVCGQGHQQPQDGSEFITLQTQNGAPQFLLSPTQLAHLLYSAYGWG